MHAQVRWPARSARDETCLHGCRYDVAVGPVKLPGVAKGGSDRSVDARHSGEFSNVCASVGD